MGKIRRKFDVQFKIWVCEQLRGGLATVSEVCQELQLSRTTVDRWLVAFDDGRLLEQSRGREKELERENERLKAKVGELTMQIDILKKSTTGNDGSEASLRQSSPRTIWLSFRGLQSGRHRRLDVLLARPINPANKIGN
jgi:transposase